MAGGDAAKIAEEIEAHRSKMMAMQQERPEDVEALAEAVLEAVALCGPEAVQPGFNMQGTGGDASGGSWMIGGGGGWSRKLSMAYTAGLAAVLLRQQIATKRNPLSRKQTESSLRLHLIGCTWDVEGAADFVLLNKVLRRALASIPFDVLRVGLLGPELHCLSADVEAALQTAKDQSGGKFVIQASPRRYDVNPPPPADIAIIFNGGLGAEFGSWAGTLQLLLSRGTPTAITGYSPYDSQGCERLLRSMGAKIRTPTVTNPFRLTLGPSTTDAFMVTVCGATHQLAPEQLEAVHRFERIAKLEDLAVTNEKEGNLPSAIRLRALRAGLVARTIRMPPEVTHSQMEDWYLAGLL